MMEQVQNCVWWCRLAHWMFEHGLFPMNWLYHVAILCDRRNV